MENIKYAIVCEKDDKFMYRADFDGNIIMYDTIEKANAALKIIRLFNPGNYRIMKIEDDDAVSSSSV